MVTLFKLFSPGLENNHSLKCCLDTFPTFTYVRVVGKLADQQFNVSLFSNTGEKVLILFESRGQICPIVFLLFKTYSPGLENNDTLQCWSHNFPTTLKYVVRSETCLNNISIYGGSPIKGKDYNAFKKFMKPGSQSANYVISSPIKCSLLSTIIILNEPRTQALCEKAMP